MPRNFSELKSGGTIPMLSPHAEKWGDASPPPRPPPIDVRARVGHLAQCYCFLSILYNWADATGGEEGWR